MSLTPPQYRQMKQYLESSSRLSFEYGGIVKALQDLIAEGNTNFKSMSALKDKIKEITGKRPGGSFQINQQDYGPLLKQFTFENFKSKKKGPVISGDDTESLKTLEAKVNKLNRINKLSDKGINFKVVPTSGGNFTTQLSYNAETYRNALNKTKSTGPLEDLVKEFNKFKKTELFKNYNKSEAMKAAGVKSGETQVKKLSNKIEIFDYLNKNPNANTLKIAEDLNISQKLVKSDLRSLYTDLYKAISNTGAAYLNPKGENAIDKVRDSIKLININERINLRDKVKNLVIDAYRGDKQNLTKVLQRLDDFYSLQSEIRKYDFGKFFVSNLDHVIPLSFLRQVEDGVDPLNLIKVKPLPEFLNQPAFKKQLDQVLAAAFRSGDKKAFEAVVNLRSYLPEIAGGITQDGKIADYKAKSFSLTSDLSQKNSTKIYDEVFKFIKDPNLQPTFEEAKVSFKALKTQEPNIKKAATEFEKQYKPGSPLYEKLMRFCPNAKANGGTAGACSIDEAITGMKNEITKVRTGAATAGEASRLGNKLKNVGSKGFRTLVRTGVLSEVFLESALAFDKVISEGESTMQALRKSYLTAPFRGLGLMKSYDEGVREELISAASERVINDKKLIRDEIKDKIEYVLDSQELINDKNEAVKQLQRLKDNYQTGLFGVGVSDYIDNSESIREKIIEKQAEIKDKYRSGKLSRAEELISGFEKPMDLNIKDKAYYDALVDAQEKLSVINAPKFVPPGSPRKDQEGNLIPSILEERRLKKRIEEGDMLTPEKINKYLQEQNLPVDETVNILGGYDKILKDAGTGAIAEAGGVSKLAGGGIAKQAGDPSGAMLENMNPDSQGLSGLFKRAMKIKE